MPKRMEMLGRTQQAPTPFEATTGRPAMQAGPAQVDMNEMRIDPNDGNAYTRQSFVDVYGEWGYLSVWDAAQQVAPAAPEETAEQLVERCKDYMEERAVAAANTWQDPGARQKLVSELVNAMGQKPQPGAIEPIMAAYGLAGAVREMGAASLAKFDVEASMRGLLQQKPKTEAMAAAVTSVALIMESLGHEAVALAKPLLGRLLMGSEGSVKTRAMTDTIVETLITAASGEDVEELVGGVIQVLGQSSRKAKAVALALLDGLARRDNEPDVQQGVATSVPAVMPLLIECCHETDPKISDTANAALESVTLTIDHSETQKLRKLLLSAILFADKHTHECLDALSEMTFVNALEAPSLALMVPVLARGLREKGSAVVKQASVTSSNIFALVRHPRDLAPFLPILMPELKNAAGHSNPEVREKALIALGVVQKGQQQASDDKESSSAVGASLAAANAGGEDDYLLDVRGFILAFSGRVLLKSAELLIRTGHCYGIVGQNGAGKTTLLTRIAAGDIDGFPASLNCYYVQHEILDEGSTTVVAFMGRQAPDGTAVQIITDALDMVGFSKAMQNSPVSDLSGGWRMKLAIARSMLWSPDLLLLDEPTNHLDVAAVEWLGKYICSLNGKTTVMIVSHDYDFLQEIATDIIHMTDQQMRYHNCGFAEFQRANPEVVEALPSVERTVTGANTEAEIAEAKAAAARQQRISKLELEPEPEPEPAPVVKAPTTGGGHKAGAERIRSAMEEKEAAALARAKERALKADALVDECEAQLAEAKKELAEANKKLRICQMKNDQAQMKVKKWIGKKLGKEWAEVRKEVKKFGDNLVKRQAAVAECEQAVQDAENLVAEAMQDRAGDRSFIGQIEAEMKQAAEDVEPTTMEEAVEAATRKDAAVREKASDLLPIEFPDPGKLSADKKGFLSTKANVIKIDDLTFGYPGADKPVILDVNFNMTLQSRCALLGKNGAGKTTLMKLIVGELSIKNEEKAAGDEEEEEEESEVTVADGQNKGQIWKHRNVRVSYVAQHSMHHLESALDATPITYIQNRFRFGKDKETTQRFALTPDEQKLMQRKGAINGVVERKLQGKQILYGVTRTGRKDDHDIDWEMLVNLEMKDP